MGYIVPLVVETGAGLSNSNSYVAVADADEYFAARMSPTSGPNQIWLPFPAAQPGVAWLPQNQYPQYSYTTDNDNNIWVQIVAGTQRSGTPRPSFESRPPGSTIIGDGGCSWYNAGPLQWTSGPGQGYTPLVTINQPFVTEDVNGNLQMLNVATLLTGSAAPSWATVRGVTTDDGSTAGAWICLGPYVSTNDSAIGLPRPITDPYYNLIAAALIKASAFTDFYWRAVFKGQKATYAQQLAWPRVGATIDEGAYDTAVVFYPGYGKSISTFIIGSKEIPLYLKWCVTEIAQRVLSYGAFQYPADLATDISNSTSAVKSERVGPIQVEYEKAFMTPVTIYRMAEMLMAPLVRGGGGTVPMARG